MMEGRLSNLLSKIGMTGRHYTEQEKAKVRAMIRYGLSKNKAAQILHIAPATIWRWNIPAIFKNRTYPRETKLEAIRLYKSGLSRLKISIKLGVGMRALNRWLGKSKDGREFKMYPPAVRQKARLLAKAGVPKFEIPNILHVSHPTIIRWTSDIKEEGDRVSGRYFKMFADLINDGFIIMGKKNVSAYRLLRRYAKVKAIVFGKWLTIVVPGKEKVALKAFLEAKRSKRMTKRKIRGVIRSFGGTGKHGI